MTKPFYHLTIRELFHHPNIQGRFGVEIECEGTALPAPNNPAWAVHNEGSLRNNGIEYVLTQPLDKEPLNVTLLSLQHRMRDARLRPSYRTSTHIHINMLHETLETTLRFICIYTIFDLLFNHICGPLRDGNLFCLGARETGDVQLGITLLIAAAKHQDFGGQLPRGKYASLNMQPLWRFGSLECRIFPMSIDPPQILGWTDWLQRILDYANGNDNLRNIINNCISNPDIAVMNILGRNPTPDEPRFVVEGAQHAHEVARIINSELYKKKEKGVSLSDLERFPEPMPVMDDELPPEEFDVFQDDDHDADDPPEPEAPRPLNAGEFARIAEQRARFAPAPAPRPVGVIRRRRGP